MSDTERIYSLYVQANPVPHPYRLLSTREETQLLMIERSQDMDTQTRTEIRDTRRPPRRKAAAVAFAAVIVLAGAVAGIALLTGNGSQETIAGGQTPEIATVHAVIDAWNTSDVDAYATYWAKGAKVEGRWGVVYVVVGSPEMEQAMVERQAWGAQMTLSDCELIDGTVHCIETLDDPIYRGKAGLSYTREADYSFNEEGLITGWTSYNSNWDDVEAFGAALGTWMEEAHPEVLETYYVPDFLTPKYENWFTSEGVAQLSQLVDEFVAQSDVYPLSP